MVRLVRSWPASPPDKPHVVDDAERVIIDDYDYRHLPDGDLIHLDWDMAVHREDLERFAEFCSDSVVVAPYLMYADSKKHGYKAQRGRTRWALRRYEGNTTRICTEDDKTCHLFGFGMIYLPDGLIRAAAAEFPDRILDDATFSQWHYRNHGEVPIVWEVRPVHLHYRISKVV